MVDGVARHHTDNWRWRNYQDSVAGEDERDVAARREAARPVCTAARRAPYSPDRFEWRHPDAKEIPHQSNRMTVTMACPHCGHEWREPR